MRWLFLRLPNPLNNIIWIVSKLDMPLNTENRGRHRIGIWTEYAHFTPPFPRFLIKMEKSSAWLAQLKILPIKKQQKRF